MQQLNLQQLNLLQRSLLLQCRLHKSAPKPQPSAPVLLLKKHQLLKLKLKPNVPAKKQQADATVRVDTSTLDTIMNMVGELVLVRNRLVSLRLKQ